MDRNRWEEIQATFDTLVELDAVERGCRLSALDLSDPELRIAVASLLAADAEADARLASLEAVLLRPSVTAVDPIGLSGRAISHFHVREPIGAGGMGVVYRAEDTVLGRQVALKFLLPSYNLDAAAKVRFLREGHAAAALDHPNLCTIHEVGTTEDGRLFLAMALYAGETLKARLVRRGALPVAEALDIARQVAEGLRSAHESGVVHRDLKPANVMLPTDSTVKILDFGLAKARDQSLSETGARLGTVAYMAPEQIRGGRVDGRADLWALGVVLYEMIAGRKPFDGEQDIAVAHAILHQNPAPLSSHRRNISGVAEDVVLRLLEKDPASRYSSAAELLADFAKVGTARAGARDLVRRYLHRGGHAVARNASRLAATGAATALIGAGLYGAVSPRGGASGETPTRMAIAVLPFRDLSGDGSNAYLASGLHEEILNQLYRVPSLKVISRNSVLGYGRPNPPPLRQIARELGVGSIVDASVQVVGKRARVNVQLLDATTEAPLWVERYDRTLEDALTLQNDIARQIAATVGAALSGGRRTALPRSPTTKAEAYLLYLRGREIDRHPTTQREQFDSAMALYEQAVALDPEFALARASLSINHGKLYWRRLDMTPARLARQRAEAEAALRLAPDLPQAHESMGAVYNTGPETDVRNALEEYEIALRSAPNDASLWRGVAAAYRRLGKWDEYDVPFEKAVQLDPRNFYLLQDYGGFTHERMGRYAEAIRWHDRALSVEPEAISHAIERAWVYVSWKGQLDTLRAVLSGPPGEFVLRNRWFQYHCRFLLFDRQADSLLRFLTWAHQVRPSSRVRSTTLQFIPDALYAAWAHQLRGDGTSARAAFDSALVFLDSAIAVIPEDWPLHQSRGMALAGLGRRDEALREARWLRTSFIYRKDLFLRPYVEIGAAQILAHAGESDAAINDLDRLLSDRFPAISVHTLRLDPVWDPVRQHPRFRALLTKYAR
jgi:TolB-like protein/Tfp pilus assembly protein PilF